MILLEKTISEIACKCCGKTKDMYRIVAGKTFDSAELIYLCEDCRKDLVKKLNATIVPDGEPEEHGGKWFQIWKEDKQSVLATMHKNLAADLDAGYKFEGKSIQKQLADISKYTNDFDYQIINFATMSDGEVSRWCYYDLKKRGAIE